MSSLICNIAYISDSRHFNILSCYWYVVISVKGEAGYAHIM